MARREARASFAAGAREHNDKSIVASTGIGPPCRVAHLGSCRRRGASRRAARATGGAPRQSRGLRSQHGGARRRSVAGAVGRQALRCRVGTGRDPHAEHAPLAAAHRRPPSRRTDDREALSGVDVLSVSPVPEYVEQGIVLGFDVVSGKPRLLVNLGQARLQHVALRAEVLKLMKVYGE
jgi:hypothetical protein